MGRKLKVSIIGDSISTYRGLIPDVNRWFYDSDDANLTGITDPSETWWMKVIDHMDGELLSNASFSGCMVQGECFPAGSSKVRAKQILGEDGSEPDIVFVYMGINDYGWGSPEAQAKGGSCASIANYDANMHAIDKPFDIDGEYDRGGVSQIDPHDYENALPTGLAPEGALERFEESYETMLRNLREVAPSAKIVCVTLSPGRVVGEDNVFCYKLRGIELDDYNSSIENAAMRAGAEVADIRGFGFDYASIDGTHPNVIGMQQIADMILVSLGLMDELPNELFQGMESVRHPQDDYVAGAPYAPISEDGWKCIAPA